MKVNEVLKMVNDLLPGNRFDDKMKTLWLSEVDGKIFDELGLGMTILREGRYTEEEIMAMTKPEMIFWYRKGPRWTNDVLEALKEDEEQQEAEPDHGYAEQIDPLNMGFRRVPRIRSELKRYEYPADDETILIAPDRFSDVYTHYIIAKIHAADGEIEEYNNAVIMYTAAYQDFCSWWIRGHRDPGRTRYIF